MDEGKTHGEGGAGPDRDGYRSYLLRCWRETGRAGDVTWRFRLQPVAGGEQQGFQNLRALFEYVARTLPAELEATSPNSDSGEPPRAER